MSKISPLAHIHPDAIIGENCEIGPFCYIDKGVVIGDDNTLMNSVTILYGARIGKGNIFFPGAVISAIPQDLKFQGEDTIAEIGDNNKIRENVTINRGTAAQGRTHVGSGNLLMESVHVAHDAFHQRVIIDMVEYILHIHCLDVEELIAREGGILTHHSEIGTGFAILRHHLLGRIDIKECHGEFFPLHIVVIFLKHSHFEGT